MAGRSNASQGNEQLVATTRALQSCVVSVMCRKEILGIILVKELVLIDMNAKTRVADLRIRSLPYLRADVAMYDLLKLFQTGRSHMVVLTQPPPAADGSVSHANSTDVTVQIEEAKERVSPEVSTCFTVCSTLPHLNEACNSRREISGSMRAFEAWFVSREGLALLPVSPVLGEKPHAGQLPNSNQACCISWYQFLLLTVVL